MNPNCSCPFCKKPNWISKRDFVIETSKFLGYPKCCAEAYADDVVNSRPPDDERMKGHFIIRRQLPEKDREQHSFVPCLRHSIRIVREKKNFRRMFRKRICSTPFPYSSKDEFKKYLKSIKKKYANNKTED